MHLKNKRTRLSSKNKKCMKMFTFRYLNNGIILIEPACYNFNKSDDACICNLTLQWLESRQRFLTRLTSLHHSIPVIRCLCRSFQRRAVVLRSGYYCVKSSAVSTIAFLQLDHLAYPVHLQTFIHAIRFDILYVDRCAKSSLQGYTDLGLRSLSFI